MTTGKWGLAGVMLAASLLWAPTGIASSNAVPDCVLILNNYVCAQVGRSPQTDNCHVPNGEMEETVNRVNKESPETLKHCTWGAGRAMEPVVR